MRVVCNYYVLILICFGRRSLMWIRLLSLRQGMVALEGNNAENKDVSSKYFLNLLI